MKIAKQSVLTGKMNEMEISVDEEKYNKWINLPHNVRPLIQIYFPELTVDEREFLLTGMTAEEWKLFEKEDAEFMD